MVPRLDPSRPVPDQDLTQVPGFLHHLPVQLGPFLAQGLEEIQAAILYSSFLACLGKPGRLFSPLLMEKTED